MTQLTKRSNSIQDVERRIKQALLDIYTEWTMSPKMVGWANFSRLQQTIFKEYGFTPYFTKALIKLDIISTKKANKGDAITQVKWNYHPQDFEAILTPALLSQIRITMSLKNRTVHDNGLAPIPNNTKSKTNISTTTKPALVSEIPQMIPIDTKKKGASAENLAKAREAYAAKRLADKIDNGLAEYKAEQANEFRQANPKPIQTPKPVTVVKTDDTITIAISIGDQNITISIGKR
jgi:hypothetical protein